MIDVTVIVNGTPITEEAHTKIAKVLQEIYGYDVCVMTGNGDED